MAPGPEAARHRDQRAVPDLHREVEELLRRTQVRSNGFFPPFYLNLILILIYSNFSRIELNFIFTYYLRFFDINEFYINFSISIKIFIKSFNPLKTICVLIKTLKNRHNSLNDIN